MKFQHLCTEAKDNNPTGANAHIAFVESRIPFARYSRALTASCVGREVYLSSQPRDDCEEKRRKKITWSISQTFGYLNLFNSANTFDVYLLSQEK